jgi:hypothetical protein
LQADIWTDPAILAGVICAGECASTKIGHRYNEEVSGMDSLAAVVLVAYLSITAGCPNIR